MPGEQHERDADKCETSRFQWAPRARPQVADWDGLHRERDSVNTCRRVRDRRWPAAPRETEPRQLSSQVWARVTCSQPRHAKRQASSDAQASARAGVLATRPPGRVGRLLDALAADSSVGSVGAVLEWVLYGFPFVATGFRLLCFGLQIGWMPRGELSQGLPLASDHGGTERTTFGGNSSSAPCHSLSNSMVNSS